MATASAHCWGKNASLGKTANGHGWAATMALRKATSASSSTISVTSVVSMPSVTCIEWKPAQLCNDVVVGVVRSTLHSSDSSHLLFLAMTSVDSH